MARRGWLVQGMVALLADSSGRRVDGERGHGGCGAHPTVFSTLHHGHGHPVAGRVFTGLAVTNNSGLAGNPEPFSAVRRRPGRREALPAHKTTTGSATTGHTQVITCAWHIPANAGGTTLRLSNNHSLSLQWSHRAYARVGDAWEGASPVYLWRVLKP
jgi:hypothetical protein